MCCAENGDTKLNQFESTSWGCHHSHITDESTESNSQNQEDSPPNSKYSSMVVGPSNKLSAESDKAEDAPYARAEMQFETSKFNYL